MKERPIIFNAHSVQAILAGEKTQTRRVVKPQPAGNDFGKAFGYPPGSYTDNSGDLWPCPYGATGDRLWVRERWAVKPLYDLKKPSRIPHNAQVYYQADVDLTPWERGKWRPAIFMPRWASRITLAVTAVQVERLQDITDSDAIAEGVQAQAGPGEVVCEFARLWDAVSGHKHPWDSNPYVWAVTFERVDTD